MKPKSDKKKPKSDKDAAKSVSANGIVAVNRKKTKKHRYLKESDVQRMSAVEYEKRSDEVMEAIRSGKFIYDMCVGYLKPDKKSIDKWLFFSITIVNKGVSGFATCLH